MFIMVSGSLGWFFILFVSIFLQLVKNFVLQEKYPRKTRFSLMSNNKEGFIAVHVGT